MDIAAFRHSLRTPLNHIVGYSEMLIEDAEASSESQAHVELRAIQLAAHQLLQLIQRTPASGSECAPETEFGNLRSESEPVLKRLRQAEASLTTVLGFRSPDLLRIVSATDTLESLLERTATISQSAPVPATGEQPVRRARLLVVDDDENNRDMLQRQLSRMGYLVDLAASGAQALELLAIHRFDLILLDIVMPGMDGFEVLTRIKASSSMREIPVIVISALDEMKSVTRCIEMGADDFIAKPFERVILQARISAATQRRAAEHEREQLADRLRQLLESTSEGIFGIDCQGNGTFINVAACKMLGYSRQDILGKDVHAAMHSKYADSQVYPPEQCPMNRAAVEGKGSRVVDEVFWRANGESFPVEYSSNPILHDGQLQGAVITFSDISERKRTDEKFREAAKLESLGVLAGGVAHDFNNLLTGILGNASLVLYSKAITDADRERLGFVIQASERAADLTKQLLAYAGKGRYETRTVDVHTLVKDTAALLQAMIPRTVRLEQMFAPTSAVVEGDPTQIQQVIMNLVINAGEAIGAPRTGTVQLRTYAIGVDEKKAHRLGGDVTPGEYVVLEVSDTGSGMSAEVQARIFDPFYTTKFTGRGLGLAAVAGIVKSHHGGIEVESALGKGSRFRVYLPASPKVAKADEQIETVSPKPSSGVVLVVDDEQIVLQTTRAMLENSGYEVLIAAGGEEAISVFREHAAKISLVLLDVMMPGMSGDQAFRHLRAIRPEVPIIVSSGYSETQVMRYFSGSRVSAYIQKPYTSNRLNTKITSVLEGAPLVRSDA